MAPGPPGPARNLFQLADELVQFCAYCDEAPLVQPQPKYDTPVPADPVCLTSPEMHALVQNNYWLHYVRRLVRSRIKPMYKNNPLILYQMGKVGSETLEASLQSHDIKRPIVRVHSLIVEHIEEALSSLNLSRAQYFQRSRLVLDGTHFAKELSRDLHKTRWQVITMVRDPVAQNISSFFQILDMIIPDFEARLQRDCISLDELMEQFVTRYPIDSPFANWFKVEMQSSFDIDVFAYDFDVEAGYRIYREPQINLLLLRLEDLDRVAQQAIREFLDIDNFSLQRTNEATQKNYYKLYKRFCTEAAFPSAYVDGIYDGQIAQHFYNQAELERFKAQRRIAA